MYPQFQDNEKDRTEIIKFSIRHKLVVKYTIIFVFYNIFGVLQFYVFNIFF